MRAALREVLASPSYREAARVISAQLAGVDGAIGAANEVEMMLTNGGAHRAVAAA
jgi:hypothetical protein